MPRGGYTHGKRREELPLETTRKVLEQQERKILERLEPVRRELVKAERELNQLRMAKKAMLCYRPMSSTPNKE